MTLLRKYIKTRLRAFTLVELLIVIVIIAVLVGAAVPGYYSVRAKMEDEKAKFNLSQIYNAQKAYKVDNQTYSFLIDDLMGYIDFTDDDGHWDYFINEGTAMTFKAEARHQATGRSVFIDQNNEITSSP